nr:serine hydrolase domain-containing protein [Oceanibacterium hippocampi]
MGAAGSLFPWWSFAKTLLAICALRLAEQGRIDLDRPSAEAPFTLRQLLQHRAGVPNYGQLPSYHEAVARGDPPWSRETLLAAVGADQPEFPPGTGWSYSNVGYMLVREAVERACECPLAGALKQLVLDRVEVPSVRVAVERGDLAEVHWPDVRPYDPGWVYHGCVVGSAVDAAKVLAALFAGQILGPASVSAMLARHDLGGALPDRPWTACGYGLGLMSGEMGAAGRAIGHSGGGPGCVNAVYHFPDLADPVTVAVFTDGVAEGVAEFAARDIALHGELQG